MSDGSTASTFSYARIYEEQQPRLVAYARSLTRNSWTAEDLVAEAHFRVWRRLSEGHEIDNVPAYLMTTVRNLATAAAGTAVRETPRDPHSDERVVVPAQGTPAQAPGGGDPAEQVSSVDLLVRVLGQLPERWVKALWLAEAEGQPLAAIGPQVGTKEGATAVLLHRAREGMRQAYLRVQAGAPDDPACQVHWARMPAYVRGTATERQSERLLGHVDTCDDCRARLAALMTANDRLPALVGPALLVFVAGGAGKYLLAGAAGGTGGGVLAGVRTATAGGSKTAVAAGAVVASAAVLILALGPGYSTPTPAERAPVAEAPAAQAPVAEAPVAGTPVSGGGGDTTRQAAGVDSGGGSGGAYDAVAAVTGVGETVVTQPQGGDQPTETPSDPADGSVPPPTDPAPAPAPQKPVPPTKDTPEKPAPPAQDTPEEPTPPAQDTPEDPAPPTEDTPAPAAPSTPAPDPAPESPTPVDPAPAETPTPADPPASTPPPTTPPPTTTAPEPTEPPATADPAPTPEPAAPEPAAPEPTAPEPTVPGDNCPAPEDPYSPAQE
ncbi:sigma-70 family RNA polymerase sigma factor [Streptomyces sp. NBC_00663]|uniref:sigma-70 family RNA polymerase sigma factor n=1 Tax=Streptomyces sp. NBC_00663 TaxID=2975801 RepID=UPI002E31EF52|nr:sigma-70 family RNA polymerase sigma factor [Streptomyces sp. NBC_00663]